MAELLKWTADLSIGIELIDDQHRRIVDYINRINEARDGGDSKAVGAVLAGLSDYTLSHFGFEEAVMREARFAGLPQHRRTHERFARQLAEYGHRYALGEEVAGEVLDTLNKWLLNHIKREDHEYMDTVKAVLSPQRLAQILAELTPGLEVERS